MCPVRDARSSSALHNRGFGNTVVHSENGKLKETTCRAVAASDSEVCQEMPPSGVVKVGFLPGSGRRRCFASAEGMIRHPEPWVAGCGSRQTLPRVFFSAAINAAWQLRTMKQPAPLLR